LGCQLLGLGNRTGPAAQRQTNRTARIDLAMNFGVISAIDGWWVLGGLAVIAAAAAELLAARGRVSSRFRWTRPSNESTVPRIKHALCNFCRFFFSFLSDKVRVV
jgi:hypothetical protein